MSIPFPPGKLLVVVLHLIDCASDDAAVEHTLAQAALAADHGADGFALCPSVAQTPVRHIVRIATAVHTVHPQTPIIINFMIPPADALAVVPAFAHLWTDMGVSADGLDVRVASCVRRADWDGTWLAGFFHKGSNRNFEVTRFVGPDGAPREFPDFKSALLALTELVLSVSTLPITSGAGTGSPPVPAHCALLHTALQGRARLASASGTTAANVGSLIPFIDIFLVGTGIEKEPDDPIEAQFYREAGIPGAKVGWLDADKLSELARLIHEQ
jgi:hypothetical protein